MSTLMHETGIILRRVKQGETSLILTAFTRESGKVALMAKGVRARSKHGGTAGLELLTEFELVYYRKPSREVQLLKEWSLVAPHHKLRENLSLLAVGNALAELLSLCMRDSDPHPESYRAASATLMALDDRPASPLPLFWKFEVDLFRDLGFGFQWETCSASGRPLQAPFSKNICFRLSDGSFFHPLADDQISEDGSLSPGAFAVLSKLPAAGYEFLGRLHLNPRIQTELNNFFSRYLETHLPVRGRLRSLSALQWGKTERDHPSSPVSSPTGQHL